MATKKQYSDEDKASALAALDANGGNASKTARDLGIPRITLLDWSKNRGVSDAVSDIRQVKKVELADRLRVIQELTINQIEARITEFEPRDLTGLLKVSTEMSQLLNGDPTQNLAVTWESIFAGAANRDTENDPYA